MRKLLYLFFGIIFLSNSIFAEKLRLLVWEGYFPEFEQQTIKKIIMEKYILNISFEVTFVKNSSDFFTLIRSENVDIIAPTHNLLFDSRYNLIKNNFLIPIEVNNIPNLKYILPGIMNLNYHTLEGQLYAVPFANGFYGLAYNTGKINNPPTSWKDLLLPIYSKKYIIVGDYIEVNIYIAALASGVLGSELNDVNKVYTPTVLENLKKLKNNSDGFWYGTDKASDLKGKLLATSWGFSFSDLKKENEIWNFAIPKEGTPWWIDNFSITYTLKNNPKLKRIAEELINYLISPKVQYDLVYKQLSAIPVNINTPIPEEIKQSFNLYDDSETFTRRRILWPTLDRRARNTYKLMWEKTN